MHTKICSTLCIIAKIWNRPRCPTIDEWITKIWYIIYIYIQWNTMFMQLQGRSNLLQQPGWTGGDDIEWSKREEKRQTEWALLSVVYILGEEM